MTATNKTRILFVDDEHNVLQSVKRWAIFGGSDWEIRFAEGGRQALADLSSNPADLVISDMRMPEMNGAELLTQVRSRYPDTGRIILSGHSDKEHMAKAFSVTHSYFGKPIDMSSLKIRIEKICKYRRIINNMSLRSAVSGLSRMPVTQRGFEAFGAALGSPDRGKNMETLAQVLEHDIFFSAKIQHLSHFLFSNDREEILPIRKILSDLGGEVLHSFVSEGGLLLPYPPGSGIARYIDKISRHCNDVANIARDIVSAATGDAVLAECAYQAGRLHNVGSSVFLDCLAIDSSSNTLADCEQDSEHSKISAYLLGLWGFSNVIIEGVEFHHEPRLASRGDCAAVAAAVHIADTLVHKGARGLDWDLLEELGWVKGIRVWRDAVAMAR